MTQGITCDKHRLHVEQAGASFAQAGTGMAGQEAAWTGRSGQEAAWTDMNKLGTRLDLMPLPMMEA